MKKHTVLFGFILISGLLFSFFSCDDSDDDTRLKNNCIKRTIGPHVQGTDIEFAYAMAVPPEVGRITSAQVEASIPGAEGTFLENNSYHTGYSDKGELIDIPVRVGTPSVTDGTITTVEFDVDTCAATLRYYYIVPQEAKGKNVTFTFSATASNGEKVSYQMGPYKIAEMDMILDLALTAAACYISVEDMAVYNATEAAAIPDKIDLVYLFRNYEDQGVKFNHAFAAPAADASKYLPGVSLPEGVNKDTKIRDIGVLDAHLARLHLKPTPEAQPAIYIDDIDLRDMDFTGMPNHALDIITKDGMWIETQDGKYKAYIFANDMRKGRAGGTISMKRYTMF